MESTVEINDIIRIPLISTSIFGYLLPFELLNCRLVSIIWSDVVTELIQEKIDKFQVTFSYSDNTEGLVDAMEASYIDDYYDETISSRNYVTRLYPSTNIPAYAHYLENVKQPPCLKYTHFYFNMIRLKDPVVTDFLNKHGTNIKILKLNLDTVEAKTRTKSLLQLVNQGSYFIEDEVEYNCDPNGKNFCDPATLKCLLLEQCPNLEHLIILGLPVMVAAFPFLEREDNAKHTKIRTLEVYHKTGRLCYFNRFFKNLSAICPDLEKVALYNDETKSYGDIQNCDFLRECITTRKTCKVTDLTMNSFDNLTFRFLFTRKFNVHLKRLNVTLHLPSRFVAQKLLDFLNEQCSTLQYLTLANVAYEYDEDSVDICSEHEEEYCEPCGVRRDRNPIQFPKSMTKLKLLELSFPGRFFPEHTRPEFLTMDLKSQFPALETFWLSGSVQNVGNYFECEDDKQGSLVWLELPANIEGELIIKIGLGFPNLKVLQLSSQEDSVLRLIWTCFPQLEELDISIGMNLSSSDRIHIDGLLTGLTINQLDSHLTDECEPKLASITNLKNLKRLTIWNGSCSNCPNCCIIRTCDFITDKSVMFAFTKLRRLEYIHIDKGHKIKEESITQLCVSHTLVRNTSIVDDDKNGFGPEKRFELAKCNSWAEFHPHYGRIRREFAAGIHPSYLKKSEDHDVVVISEDLPPRW